MSAKSTTTAIDPEYDPENDRYTVHHDPESSWKPSTTVVLALGALTGENHKDMPALGRAIAPEALERLLGDRNGDADLSFAYHDHRVTVRSNGRVELTPLESRNA